MKYRKKPVVIDAWHYDGNLISESDCPAWILAYRYDGQAVLQVFDGQTRWLTIPTLEGVMNAQPGDWIIQGVKGELYPCKPDIFAATYEPVQGE